MKYTLDSIIRETGTALRKSTLAAGLAASLFFGCSDFDFGVLQRGREGETKSRQDAMAEKYDGIKGKSGYDGGMDASGMTDADGGTKTNGCDKRLFFLDSDNDGFGDARYSLKACKQEQGYVVNSDDCDDDNETIYPGAPEVCDGLDNDCNRVADNSLAPPSRECFTGIGGCRRSGIEYQVCEGAAGWSADYRNCDAVAGVPEEEICDGIDNDCDGPADNSLTPLSRECFAGIGECRRVGVEYQVCEGEAGWSDDYRNCNAVADSPALGRCDGLDNNCDGLIDNSLTPPSRECFAGVGECRTAGLEYRVCEGDAGWSPDYRSCSAVEGSPADEICDGLDNDCNSLVDNSLTPPSRECFAGVGECRRAGLEYHVCEGDAGWSVDYRNCSAVEGSSADEICDGLDNDCDGIIDEECVSQVGGGYAHSCALFYDNTVRCWGNNEYGQLGDGTTSERHTPTPVLGLDNVTQIALGGSATGGGGHTCAVLADGTARCWGSNGYGQLGDGTEINRYTPAPVSELENVAQIALGSYYTCAVLADGTARCWGHNIYGKLGDGTEINHSTPTPVSELANVAQIALGSFHTCAVLADGTARCWGNNYYSQLGDGLFGPGARSLTPIPVPGLTGVIQISLGVYHTCALLDDGTARCWGYNSDGQLGDGTRTERHTPVSVSGLTDATQIATGGFHICVVLTDSTARCWGENAHGQLGDGTNTRRLTPRPVSGLDNIVQIALGYHHTCVVLADGTARCWGYNASGQLGDGTTENRHTPTPVEW